MSLWEAVSFGVTSDCVCVFSGAGGSTGLERKASEESTQSPTEDEMVAARTEENRRLLYVMLQSLFFFPSISSYVHASIPLTPRRPLAC